jgi:alpha-tubulin suppressor-like RCC1 family protein
MLMHKNIMIKFQDSIVFLLWLFCLCFGFQSAAFAACSGPTGSAGDILYNADSNVLQYCNNTNWISFGGSGADIGWTQASGGDDHSCGIRGGAMYCWGGNASGQLGNDNLGTSSAVPVRVGTNATSTLFSDWVAVSASNDFTCGIRKGGTMWCWGLATNGKLGNNVTSGTYAYPQQVGTAGTSTIFSDWIEVATSTFTGCGIRSNGQAWCWGQGSNGRIGNNVTTVQPYPVQVGTSGSSTLFSDWLHISHRDQSGCGTRTNGTAWCWGTGTSGQLGNGASSTSNVPVQVGTVGTSTDFTDWVMTSTGLNFSCGVRANGTAWCWGTATNGELGNGSASSSSNVPVQVGTGGTSTIFTDWLTISSGSSFTCGTRSNGETWCWGLGSNGRLGNAGTSASSVPVKVGTAGTSTAFTDWIQVRLGVQTACGVRSSGGGYCWGRGTESQVGDGLSSSANSTPKALYLSCSYPTGSAGDMLYNTTYHMLQWCDGTSWNAVGQPNAGAGGGGCTGPTGTEGQLMYNTPNNLLQYCDGTNWVGIGMSEIANAPGTVEADGTVYVGISPDSGTAMYVTPADAATTYTWGSSGTLRGVTSNTTGKANTTALAAFGAAAHPAAYYCDTLVANGHSDWYLPARDELLVVQANYVAIGGFDDVSATNNWTSTESNSTQAIRIRWSDGNSSAVAKTSGRYVRCVRTD